MKTAIDIAFLEEVKKYNKHELRALVDKIYNALSKEYRKSVSFGRSVCKEFVAALILSDFDDSSLPYINHGLDQVFIGTLEPREFSIFMDKVILEKSVISYPAWSRAYRFIEKNHTWIKEHPCSGAGTSHTLIAKGIFINS